MKTIAILVTALLVFSASAPSSAQPTERGDIVATALADGRFGTLATALEKADLVEALRGKGPFTVFAPTDKAFAALPKGALAGLLEDPSALAKVLTYHVVSGRVLAGDLLKTSNAKALSGDSLGFGLRVGKANVIQADVLCSNGVIHVIDRVLFPSLATKAEKPLAETATPARRAARMDPVEVINAAIDRGVPLFNDGHVDQCARIYHNAATRLMQSEGALGAWDRMELAAAMKKPAADARAQAWNLRHAFDEIITNATFKPRMEAAMPPGFPAPGPVGHVVMKRYPQYRAARAEGGNMAFWTLFQHIKKNKVEMTAPVEMTMDNRMRARDMAFLYERPDQGSTGKQGRVDVLDLKPLTVLSIGLRGRRDAASMARAKRLIEEHMAAKGLQTAGAYRVLGYNSPMVPAAQQYYEVQVPVSK